MKQKPYKGLLKHADFVIVDLICLQICFVLAFWILVGFKSPYSLFTYKYLAAILLLGRLLTIVFSNNYSRIIRRGRLDEMISVIQFSLIMVTLSLLFLFVFKNTGTISRLQTGVTMVFYVVLDYWLRQLRKKWLYRKSANGEKKLGHSLVLITTGSLVDSAMNKLMEKGLYQTHFVSGIILTDGDQNSVCGDYSVPMVQLNDESLKRLRSKWVDEVFFLQANDNVINKNLIDVIMNMGITVHICPQFLNDDNRPGVVMQKIGSYKVLTSNIKFVSPGQMVLKRCADVVGGIIGCLITGLLWFFIAPAIKRKSPGPVFFTQERIGLNGKSLKIYKFQSMYLDAEERKSSLVKQNKVNNGLMFKIADDPRIIGSEKKGKDGKPKGIGNFIRRTSIDEFPQFWNVLKGDMSLVGVGLILRAT